VKTDAEDRRVRLVDLTPAGRALLEHDPVHRLTDAIETLSSDKKRELAGMLETLYGRLAK
jgi:DNA-binding MarR family transcriptional regulator